MKEIWKDVGIFNGIDYTGMYEVSNKANVRSLDRSVTYLHKGKVLEQSKDRKGYKHIALSKDGKIKTVKVHRLVYETFNGKIPEGMQVNHINEIKTDNRLENLNLMTPKENINWGTGIKRRSEKLINGKCSKPILQINQTTNEVIAEFPSIHQVERDLGFSVSHIRACCNNRPHFKTAGGYKWQFKKMDDP